MDNLQWSECSPLQLSAIREIANIGLGHAATALAQMTGQQFQISIPVVDAIKIGHLPEFFPSPETVALGIYMPFEGDISGHLACLFEWSSALSLWQRLVSEVPASPDEISEIHASMMLELGNILNGNFLNAIGDMVGLSLFATPPMVGVEMVQSVLTSILSEAENSGATALAIETSLFDDDDVSGFFLFIPSGNGMGTLLEHLGVSEAA